MGEAVSLSGQVTGSLSALSQSSLHAQIFPLQPAIHACIAEGDWKKTVVALPQEVPDGEVQDERSAHPEPRPATVKRLGACRLPGIRWRGSALWCRGRTWCWIDSGAGVGAPSAPLHV